MKNNTYIKCLNANGAEGLTDNKVYKVISVVDNTEFKGYVIQNDYNRVDTYRGDRFIDVEPYYFELWHCLPLEDNMEARAQDIMDVLDCECGAYTIDNEGILKVPVIIFDISELIDIGRELNGDITICGCDYDYIMTIDTMSELGLGK